jgi:hypothetical protein
VVILGGQDGRIAAAGLALLTWINHGPDTEAQDSIPSITQIWLATHGRSIQMGHFRPG